MPIGDGVYLRKLEASDLERTLKWVNTPDIAFAIGTNYPVSSEEQQNWYNRLSNKSDKIVFAICLDNDEHIGNISLDTINYRHRNARFSIFIAKKEFRRNGIGKKVMRLLSSYCFSFLNLRKIYCKTTSNNKVAREFYLKLGFKQEGIMRAHEFINGKYVDKILFSFLKNESQK